MSAEHACALLRHRVPNAYGAIERAAGQALASARLERRDRLGVALERVQTPAGGEVPHVDLLVERAARQHVRGHQLDARDRTWVRTEPIRLKQSLTNKHTTAYTSLSFNGNLSKLRQMKETWPSKNAQLMNQNRSSTVC